MASDHVHPVPGPSKGRYRIRVFIPAEAEEACGDRPVVVCTEVTAGPGPRQGLGITGAAETIRASVLESFPIADPVWIEHHPAETTDGLTETFELVHFSPGEAPEWKPLDRATVEAFVGAKLD